MTETQNSSSNGTADGHGRPPNLVWIASYPRSGNSWIRVFLWHLLRLAAGAPDNSEESLDFLGAFAASDSSRVDLFERFLGKALGEATFDEIAAVRPQVQAEIAGAAEGMIAVKTQSALGVVGGTSTVDLSLTAGAVYVVRNPLDIAVSLAAHLGTSIDEAIDRMGLENCIGSGDGRDAPEFWGSWSQHVGSWTGKPNPSIMPVRYEDMLSAPEQVFPALAKFFHLQPSDETLATARRASSFQRLREAEDRSGFPGSVRDGQHFFREGRSGSWREALNEDQIRRLVATHHVQMERVGYMTPDLMQYRPESAS